MRHFAQQTVLILTLALACVGLAFGQVQIRETKIELARFEEAAPSANAPFEQYYPADYLLYPYSVRTPVGKIRHAVSWRAIVIENEFLSCRVLPDLGGHLHGCTDKVSGKEIFYANPVIRTSPMRGSPDDDRGSFIATGIESAFPFAHSRVGSSPVDFAWSVTDGTGRVVVEDVDRVTGMEWHVEFVLRPGVASLEQRVTLHNASPGRRGYQWWANAAVELDDPHLRILYPVKWMLPIGTGTMTAWPLNGGVDLTDVANHARTAGYFGHGSKEPWMAIYKPQTRSGLVHFADAGVVKGKKIFLWGDANSRVKETLTENFNSYVEMQAGLGETQSEFAYFEPGESKTFSEFWIPVRDMGGVSRATGEAVLSVTRKGDGNLIEVQATHAVKGARIRVSDGAKVLNEARADLDPAKTWTETVNGPAGVTVDLLNAAGATLLHHREGEIDALQFDPAAKDPTPVAPPAAPVGTTADTEAGYLARGDWKERHGQLVAAAREYADAIAKAGKTVKLEVAAGRVAFELNRFDDAIRLLEPHRAEAGQAEAAYYYGAAMWAKGNWSYAESALKVAMVEPRFGLAARVQLAQLYAREWRPAPSLETIGAAAADPTATPATGAFEVALLRRAGRTEEAKKRLEFWAAKDPANNMLRVERMLLGGAPDEGLWRHLGADPERVLNLADCYLDMGAADDALQLLERKYPENDATEREPGGVLPQEHAMVVYYRGYARLKLGKDPRADFATGAALSTKYVFPSRWRTRNVLEAVLVRNPRDGNAHNLLADYLFAGGLTDEAIREWRVALGLSKDIPGLHRNLGRALLELKGDGGGAAAVLEEGRRVFPDDEEIAEQLAKTGPARMVISRAAAPAPAPLGPAASPSPAPPVVGGGQPVVGAPQAGGDVATRALLRSALEPDAALGLFNAGNFPKDKEPNDVRRDYIEVKLQRLLTRALAGSCRELAEAIETLGDEDPGVPFTLYGFGAFMRPAHFQYYLGLAENACGDDKAAKRRWGRIGKPSAGLDSVEDAFSLLALKGAGDSSWPQKADAAVKSVHAKAQEKPEAAFIEGTLLIALGKKPEGDAQLQRAAKSTDAMVQYLALVGMRENSRK